MKDATRITEEEALRIEASSARLIAQEARIEAAQARLDMERARLDALQLQDAYLRDRLATRYELDPEHDRIDLPTRSIIRHSGLRAVPE